MSIASESELQSYYSDSRVAKSYVAERFSVELNRLLHERQVQFVQGCVDRIRPANILEIACGPGRLTRSIVPFRRFVCLDFNEEMLQEAGRACPSEFNFIRGNAFHLPFNTDFDLVYSFRFVRHFYNEDRRRLYGEISRVLRPGGWFLLDAVNRRVSGPIRESNPSDYPVYDKLYSLDELSDELQDAGLHVENAIPVQKYYRWQHRSQILLGPRSTWLNRLCIRGLERLPGQNGLEWMVACRRA